MDNKQVFTKAKFVNFRSRALNESLPNKTKKRNYSNLGIKIILIKPPFIPARSPITRKQPQLLKDQNKLRNF